MDYRELMREEFDVLVVGGGPAGLSAAHAAAAGNSILLVHRDREIGRPVRTSGGSWLQEMERLGIPGAMYHPIESLTLAGPNLSTRVGFGADKPVVLDVTGTYQYLARLAQDAGVRIECGASFQAVQAILEERVVCLLIDSQGSREIAARFVVDASGYRRSVLCSIGKAAKPARFGVGAELELEDRSRNGAHAVLFVGSRFAPTGYGWIFPTGPGTVRVGIGITRPDSSAVPSILLERFLQSDMARELGLEVGASLERHSGVIPSDGPGKTLVVGRILAVGDSAGQALPLVGEGIRFSIEAGRQVGKALCQALEDPTHFARRLARYSHWWNRTYHRRFSLAQQVNLRLAAYTDEKWDRKINQLSLLDGDMMAAFLRMEFSPAHALRLAFRHPLPVLRQAILRAVEK